MANIILPGVLLLIFIIFGIYWFSPEFKVRILLWRGANVQARKILEYLLEQHPERLNLYQKLGRIYFIENRRDKQALRIFEVILKLRVPFEWREELYGIVARQYINEKRKDAEAVRFLERAVEKESRQLKDGTKHNLGFQLDNKTQKEYITMLAALGDIYLDKALYAEAAKRYNQILDLKVSTRNIYKNLSKALIGLKRFDEYALNIYKKTIQYDPGNEEIYLTLADSFMTEKRTDEQAVRIYESALKFDSPQFEELSMYLSKIYHDSGRFNQCAKLTKATLKKQGHQPALTALFVDSSWRIGQYHSCISELKILLDRSRDKTKLMLDLCKTYLEARFKAEPDRAPKFSYVDRQLITDYLDTITNFITVQELVFFIELNRFLADSNSWGKLLLLDQTEKVEALVLVEQKKGQQSESHPEHVSTSKATSILAKMQSFTGLGSKTLTEHSALTFEDFQRGQVSFGDSQAILGEASDLESDILLVIELSNYNQLIEVYGQNQVQQNRKKFFAILADLLEKYQYSQIWGTDNGILLFTNDIIQSVSFAVDILNKVNRFNFVSNKEQEIHLSIGVHHSRHGISSDDKQFLKDLNIVMKTATVSERDLPDEDRTIYGKVFDKSNRIFLSGKAYREIKSSKRFKVNSVGQFRLRYIPENLSLHEVAWRNPVDDLKFGFVKKLGRFDLLAELGSKGEDVKVYKGKDSDLQRFVIVKVIQSEVFNSLPAGNPHKQEFYQKAKAFGQMNHPNIANIYDVDEDLGLSYITREYVEGYSITDLFQKGELNIEHLIKVMYQVFKGLQYSHRLGHCHLNLKPNNVRAGGNSEAKIMDFRIPSSLFETMENNPDGKYYLSPEQVTGQSVDSRSDIFAMGVILYETATGRHPFLAESFNAYAQIVFKTVPPLPSAINARTPKFLDALIMRCMAVQPDKRIQSAEQIVTLLKKNFERTLFSNFNYHIAQSRDAY